MRLLALVMLPQKICARDLLTHTCSQLLMEKSYKSEWYMRIVEKPCGDSHTLATVHLHCAMALERLVLTESLDRKTQIQFIQHLISGYSFCKSAVTMTPIVHTANK